MHRRGAALRRPTGNADRGGRGYADCLQACIEGGASAFLELGPGAALSQMVATTYAGVAARSLDDFRTLEGAREWVGRHTTL